MTAQRALEAKHVKAYVFVMSWASGHTDVAAIASSVEEAEAELRQQCTRWGSELTFFNIGVALMKPAMIERWPEHSKRIEAKGCYAFLNGTFFCKCGDYQKVTTCKQIKDRTGWTALIYGNSHIIRPL